jgi:hypothetical protein
MLMIAGSGTSHAQSSAQSGPPIVAVPMREPTPRNFTRPIVTLTCRMIDEASHWLPVTFTIIGARARYAVYPEGRKVVVKGRPSYRISSTDPRIQGWKNVENSYNARGVAFNGPDGLVAIAQLDEDAIDRFREGILNLSVSENSRAKRVARYTGFCAASFKPQEPDPDQQM